MFGELFVVNYKNFDKGNDDKNVIINIMRPNILSNPFVMNNEDERELVIVKFYHYLREEYQKKDKVYNELIRIKEILESGKNVYLLCCCKPKNCHGDIIKKAIKGILDNESRKK